MQHKQHNIVPITPDTGLLNIPFMNAENGSIEAALELAVVSETRFDIADILLNCIIYKFMLVI